MLFRIQLAERSTCPYGGASSLLMPPNYPPSSQRTPQPLFLSRRFSGVHRPPYLALTVSLKLSQFQGDLGILATCRNESEVSPACVTHIG